jgi:ABC-type antimicrobial peptide transport system permease subunit
MIRNYFKVAWRNLVRNKSFSIINISGLAIGMAGAILIILWVQNEVSHDRFYHNLDRLYEVWSNDRINGSIRSLTNTPEIMAPSLKKDFPELERVTRLRWTRNLLSDAGDKRLMSVGAVVDSDFLAMFDFPLISGNAAYALSDPHGIVITRNLARKLFNTDDPIGRTVRMGGAEIFKVTGVLKDLPNNTQFDYIEYLCSYGQQGNVDSDWTDISIATFVQLKPNASPEGVNAKLKDIIPQHTHGIQKTQEFLYPVSQLWLYSQFENGKAAGGRITYVRIFSTIAMLILLIACINFMNLSTARSERRAKEVGVRKVSGAMAHSLVGQFIGESVLIASISAMLAIFLVELSLPGFNQLTGKQLRIEYDNIYFWLSGIAFVLFTGLLAGSYPAFVLSSFRPVSVLKGVVNKVNATALPRKILVVLQFSFAIALVICTLVITKQIKYAQQREIGYEGRHLINIFIYEDSLRVSFDRLKNELLASRAASSVALVNAPLTENWSSGLSIKWQGKNPSTRVQINRQAESGDLVQAAGMKLVLGRDIDIRKFPSDSTACLINESAVHLMNFKQPIGQLIYDDPVEWHVVGVIRDYIQESPYQPVRPMIIKGPKAWMGVILVKLNSARSTSRNLAEIEKIFGKFNPDYPFEYTFTDEEYGRKFNIERLSGKLAGLFAGLTIFISCLGLFGLAAYMAHSRTKEIGIRKVLGASVGNIFLLLSKDFVRLVGISILIASPLAWWVMNNWLANFDYRIGIPWWIFLLAGLSSISVALFTVSYESFKAAVANPVGSLKTE